jgi:hypothetical protein
MAMSGTAGDGGLDGGGGRSGRMAPPMCLDDGLAAMCAVSWALASCVIPTVAAATPVNRVATRIDLLVRDFPLAALMSCSCHPCLTGKWTASVSPRAAGSAIPKIRVSFRAWHVSADGTRQAIPLARAF